MNIEPLEARIAPAKLLSLVDVDGDLITITTTKGTDAQLLAAVGTSVPAGAVPGGVAIGTINLAGNAVFDGTSITITAKRGPLGGDGLVNVGRINADLLDLGTVTVKGDLADLDAGKNTPASKVAAINVHSATGSPIWQLQCSVGSLTVKTDVTGPEINVSSAGATLGKLAIGGSLIGTDVNASSYIHVDNGTIGKVTIGGSIVGSSQGQSGLILAASIGSVTVAGSLVGGGGTVSGGINATDAGGSLGPVVIRGDVRGGGGNDSGRIVGSGTVGNVTIGGSLLGGAGFSSGVILGNDGIGKVTIGHDLAGGTNVDTGRVHSSAGGIGGVTIGGSLLGGTSFSSGRIAAFAGNIGPILIRGDLQAGPANSSGTLPNDAGAILAQIGTPADVNFASIASITIGGNVIGRGANPDAQIFSDGSIGPVKIGGDLRGGSGANSGKLEAGKTLGLVTLGGSVLGGTGVESANIEATGNIAGVKIGGSLVLGSTAVGGRVISDGSIGSVSIGGDFIGSRIDANGIGAISIRGNANTGQIIVGDIGSPTPLLLKSLTIGGSAIGLGVRVFSIDGIIGPVKVGGNWREGTIAAGVSFGPDSSFGTTDDVATGIGDPLLFSKIASITIGGAVIGTAGGTDHFGFVAQKIGALSIGGTKIPLQPGNGNDTDALASRYLISATRDFTVHEVA